MKRKPLFENSAPSQIWISFEPTRVFHLSHRLVRSVLFRDHEFWSDECASRLFRSVPFRSVPFWSVRFRSVPLSLLARSNFVAPTRVLVQDRLRVSSVRSGCRGLLVHLSHSIGPNNPSLWSPQFLSIVFPLVFFNCLRHRTVRACPPTSFNSV